jgi:hypothetical protein
MVRAEDDRHAPARLWLGCCATWAVLAASAGAFVGLWIASLNGIPFWHRDTLALAGLMSACYGAPGVALGALLSGASVLGLRGRLRRFVLPVQVGLFVAGVAFLAQRYAAPDNGRLAWAVQGALVAGAIAVIAVRALGQLPRFVFVPGALVSLGSLVLLGAMMGGRPPLPAEPASRLPQPAAPPEARHRLLFIGIDGLDPGTMEAFIQAGALPNLARLRGQGTSGQTATLWPTYSPSIWTTVATGRRPEAHGIHEFVTRVLPGVGQPVQRFPYNVGSGRIVMTLRRLGLAKDLPLTSSLRTARPLWDVLSDQGLRVAVINWWASWPPEPVNGVIVSDRFFFAANGGEASGAVAAFVHPPSILGDLRPRVVNPETLPDAVVRTYFEPRSNLDRGTAAAGSGLLRPRAERALRTFIALDRTHFAVARWLLQDASFDFVAVYVRSVDAFSHILGRFSNHLGTSGDKGAMRERYGLALENAYVEIDREVGELLALAGSDTNVIVASDHGFQFEPGGDYNHIKTAPAGELLLAGPDINPAGHLAGAHVLDLAPTMLALLGAPIGRDLEGRVLAEALRPQTLTRLPIRTVDTYGPPRRGTRQTPVRIDGEIEDGLRALGYVN